MMNSGLPLQTRQDPISGLIPTYHYAAAPYSNMLDRLKYPKRAAEALVPDEGPAVRASPIVRYPSNPSLLYALTASTEK